MITRILMATSGAALFAFASLANAADNKTAEISDNEVKGTVQEVMSEENMLVLDDGTQFMVDSNVDLDRFAPGAEVVVTFEMKDGMRTATDVVDGGYARGEEAVPQSTEENIGNVGSQ